MAATAEFSDGQVVVVDDPGMGYAYNGVIVGREPDGRYWVAAADGTREDHKPQFLTSAGWRAF